MLKEFIVLIKLKYPPLCASKGRGSSESSINIHIGIAMALHEPSMPIQQAAKDGEIALLTKASKKELNQGDAEGWTAVHWCAWTGHPEPLEVVLRKG